MYYLRRLSAFIVDCLMCGILIAPVIMIAFNNGGGAVAMLSNSFTTIALMTLQFIVYFSICELFFTRTLGKKLFRLQIISDTEGSISFGRIILRNIVRVVDHGFFPGAFLILITGKNQRIGDLISKLKVVDS